MAFYHTTTHIARAIYSTVEFCWDALNTGNTPSFHPVPIVTYAPPPIARTYLLRAATCLLPFCPLPILPASQRHTPPTAFRLCLHYSLQPAAAASLNTAPHQPTASAPRHTTLLLLGSSIHYRALIGHYALTPVIIPSLYRRCDTLLVPIQDRRTVFRAFCRRIPLRLAWRVDSSTLLNTVGEHAVIISVEPLN